MDQHRTDRLNIYGVEITKLFNSRFRTIVRCTIDNQTEGWYQEYAEEFCFAAFDTLATTPFDNGGVEAREGMYFPDQRLISVERVFPPNTGFPVVEFVYETLTSAFVQETADKVDYELNGLRRVRRSVIARDGTTYGKTVGSSTISHNEHGYGSLTLTLASAVEDAKGPSEDGYVRIIETWVKSGVLNRIEEKIGSQNAITLQTIGQTPSAPVGYTLARTQVGNYQGFQTLDYSYLKPSVLSRSEDSVGSQKAIVIEAFNETPSTPTGYVLARTRESDVEGAPTRQYTFLKPSVLSRSIREQAGGISTTGKIRLEIVEAFNQEPTSDIGGVQIGNEESDVEGIPTRRYTYATGSGEIRSFTRPGPTSIPGTTYVTVVSVGAAVVPTGVLVESDDVQEDGYVRYVRTALQGTITGTKQAYKDVVEVQTPGTVECSTQAVSNTGTTGGSGTGSGTVSGTIAVVKTTPIRTKRVAATVTVAVTDTPPNTASSAYDLGEISCSVLSIREMYSRGATAPVTVNDGSTSLTDYGFRQSFSPSVTEQNFPGHYLTSVTSSGQVTYTSSDIPFASSATTIEFTSSTSSTITKCIGTGSTKATGYNTRGVLRRRSRPILTTVAGTTYYEVITWSV